MPEPELPDPRYFQDPPIQEVLDQLEAAVTAAGGQALTHPHTARLLDYSTRPRNLPQKHKFHPQPIQQDSGCGHHTRMLLPVEGGKPCYVCVVCDAAYMFPRYA